MVPKRRRDFWIGLLGICLAAVFLVPEAVACSWPHRPFSEWYDDADEIVVARIQAAWIEDGPFQGGQHVN